MIIDFRVRAPFPAYAASPLFTHLDAVERDTRTRVDAPSPASARAFSLDLLLREADEAGVDKLVVPVRKAAGGRNEDLVALLQRHPDRLIGLAGIDVSDMTRALEEVAAFAVDGPCRGIVLEPGQDKTPWMVNAPWVYPLYAYCQEQEVPVALTYGGIMTPSLRHYAPEAVDDVAAAFPRLNLALVHGGWPYVTEACQIALNRRNVYLAPDIYMVRSPGMAEYVTAASHLLRDRVIFASAYPILPLREARLAYEQSGVRPEALPLLMGGNTARFLKL